MLAVTKLCVLVLFDQMVCVDGVLGGDIGVIQNSIMKLFVVAQAYVSKVCNMYWVFS
jgi:hypothetical protein